MREQVQDGVRPTSSRVREALFSIIGQDLSGLRVLDAFGGSGVLGLEAWSRGGQVTVVEQSARALSAIRTAGLAIGADWSVVRGDVFVVGPSLGRFDLVLADPPYAMPAAQLLTGLAPMVGGLLVYEADARADVPERLAGLRIEKRRALGSTALHLFRQEEG